MSKHTPGPWISASTGSQMKSYSQPFGVIRLNSRQLVAGCFGDVEGGEDQAKANARLIALAPELLGHLKKVIANHSANSQTIFCGTCSEARVLIQKAEGGE